MNLRLILIAGMLALFAGAANVSAQYKPEYRPDSTQVGVSSIPEGAADPGQGAKPDAVSGASRRPDAASGASYQVAPEEHKVLSKLARAASRLSLGGYGEAAYTRNFYSQHFNRYKSPEDHEDDPSHGTFDLPHVVIFIGYDFGKGWSMQSEIEFEHGGAESAVEVEADESGEYEQEIERGGEVAIEQFYIQKTFFPWLNVRGGELVIPIGETNAHHMPTEFFTVYRPEGEDSILPCTWHQVGISVWGRMPQWGYEVLVTSGLDSERFGNDSFVHDGATSPYEFKIANNYALALRIDNYSIKGLRLSASGYYGRSFDNTLKSHTSSTYDGCHGDLWIGTFGFQYKDKHFLVRGNFDYAHLPDADLITSFNKTFPSHTGSNDGTPSKHQPVGESALMYGVEAGYDIFSHLNLRNKDSKLYIFGRYEYYNSMESGTSASTYEWCKKNRFAVGLNYFPLPDIVIKAEYSYRKFTSTYNNEPSVSLGIAYSGWFLNGK